MPRDTRSPVPAVCRLASGSANELRPATQRRASAAAGSRSAAEAVGSQLHAVVRGLGGCAASHVEGTGPARAFRAMLVGRPWVVVTVPALVPCARW
jgi:hypothetical protein